MPLDMAYMKKLNAPIVVNYFPRFTMMRKKIDWEITNSPNTMV